MLCRAGKPCCLRYPLHDDGSLTLVLTMPCGLQESAQDVLTSLQPLLSQLPESDPVAQEVAAIANLVAEEQVTVSGSTVTDVLTRLLLRVIPSPWSYLLCFQGACTSLSIGYCTLVAAAASCLWWLVGKRTLALLCNFPNNY